MVDYGAKAHYIVKHSKNEFANGKNHINGIENFRGYAKHRLAKFKGIKKENFLLRLKERALLYFATLIAFQDAATNVVK